MNARPAKAPRIAPYPGLEVREDRLAWEGRFPLQLVRFTHARFDGGRSAEMVWELWRRGRSVAVLPYDPWSDRLCLIEQFRLPAHAAGLDPVMVECVAGLLEADEAPEAAARRETEEEAGLVPDLMESLGRTMLAQGGCDEVMEMFCGRVRLPETGDTLHGLAEEGEDIRLRLLDAEEAFALLDGGGIRNATAALCLWWLRHHRARLRKEWA
jgi:ADP-ribose pyrophosphatase